MTESRHVVRIEDRFDLMGVAVHLGTRLEDGTVAWQARDGQLLRTGEFDPNRPADYEPPLTIADDQARALYQALAAHFGDWVHDAKQLRLDYVSERGRVDRLIGALIQTAVGTERGQT